MGEARRWLRVALIASAVVAAAAGAKAQLVVGGETISDAKTVAAANAEGRLVVYSAIAQDVIKNILDDFQKDTGIVTELVRLPTQPLFQRIMAEFAANKLDADYLDLTDLPLIQQLVERGVLNVPYKVPAFDKISPDIRDPQGRWYSVLRGISVIAINTSRIAAADAPKSWKDVLDPKYKGLLATTSIEAGGSGFTMYAFLRQKVAPDFWKKLAAQPPRLYPSVAPLANELARGEVGIAMGAISELVLYQIKAGAPLKVIIPVEGVSSFPAAGGITASAKNPNAARLYLDWATSKRGGDMIAKALAYGANPASVPPHAEGLDYPGADKLWNMNIEEWSSLREPWMNEWRDIFGTR
jgi:iron(III) transport system substrate-binding protein